jgi:hypothetical protein
MQPYLADYKNYQDTFNRPLYEIKIILFYISIIVPQSTEKGFKAQEYHREGLLREKDGTRPDNTTGSIKIHTRLHRAGVPGKQKRISGKRTRFICKEIIRQLCFQTQSIQCLGVG